MQPYDYYLRMDDDLYLIDPVVADPFATMSSTGCEYGYGHVTEDIKEVRAELMVESLSDLLPSPPLPSPTFSGAGDLGPVRYGKVLDEDEQGRPRSRCHDEGALLSGGVEAGRRCGQERWRGVDKGFGHALQQVRKRRGTKFGGSNRITHLRAVDACTRPTLRSPALRTGEARHGRV